MLVKSTVAVNILHTVKQNIRLTPRRSKTVAVGIMTGNNDFTTELQPKFGPQNTFRATKSLGRHEEDKRLGDYKQTII